MATWMKGQDHAKLSSTMASYVWSQHVKSITNRFAASVVEETKLKSTHTPTHCVGLAVTWR
jgi:hypothetical protein